MKNKYKIYGLIDPRNNKICYIGITIRSLKKRLNEHNSPVHTNRSKIAKLKRNLLNKKFNIIQLDFANNKDEMYDKEIYYIKHYKNMGFKLYNIQPGGKITINELKSYNKFRKTRIKNKDNHKICIGENACNNILSNKQVLEIYNLIKEGYDNTYIHNIYSNICTISLIKSLRTGQNWKHLFIKNFKEPINSIPCNNKGYNGKIKLKILDLLIKDYDIKHINKWFKKISTSDLKRIKNKVIWKSVYKTRKQLSAINK